MEPEITGEIVGQIPDATYFNQDGLRFELFRGGHVFHKPMRIAKLQPLDNIAIEVVAPPAIEPPK